MRETKLFKIGLENENEAEQLKNKLRVFSIQDINNGNIYNGFINFDIEEEHGKINANIYTHLELDEFRDIIYECSEYPTFFQFDKR